MWGKLPACGSAYSPGAMRLGCLLLVAVCAAEGRAAAAGEGEWQLGAAAGYAAAKADGREPHGFFGALDLAYGLSDTWALRASLAATAHPVSADEDKELPGGMAQTRVATLGIAYTLDVLRLVPTVNLGIGVLQVGGDVKQTLVRPAVEAGVAADYYLTRRFTVGFETAYTFPPGDLATFPPGLGNTAYTFVIGARATHVF